MADLNLDGDLTEDERHYFQSGGDVNENLAKGALAPPPPESAPSPEPAQAPPAEQTTASEGDDDELPAPGPDGQAQRPRKVSFRRYEEAENARRELERQLNERSVRDNERALREARLEERLNLLSQALQPEDATAPGAQVRRQRPDPNQDIFAYTQWLEDSLNEVSQKVTSYEEQIQLGQAELTEQNKYISSMNNYAANEPHFVEAYGFLLRNRAAELMAPRYPQATYEQLMNAQIPDDIGEMIRQEERDLYKGAFQRNSNPAAEIFRMAHLRGYRPVAAPQPNGNGNGAAPAQERPGTPLGAPPAQRPAAAPATNGGPPATATAMVDAIRRGAPAAQSLSNVSGNAMPAVPTELTSEALANMDDEQFGKIFNALQNGNTAELRRLMGN